MLNRSFLAEAGSQAAHDSPAPQKQERNGAEVEACSRSRSGGSHLGNADTEHDEDSE